MSHVPAMEASEGGWVRVGWLHPDHPYPEGPVPPDFLAKLRGPTGLWGESILALNGGFGVGVHTCEYCGEVSRAGTLGVPAGDRLFYVPEMIDHHVERHRYAPPNEFITAVLACPLPGTAEYAAAVERFRIE